MMSLAVGTLFDRDTETSNDLPYSTPEVVDETLYQLPDPTPVGTPAGCDLEENHWRRVLDGLVDQWPSLSEDSRIFLEKVYGSRSGIRQPQRGADSTEQRFVATQVLALVVRNEYVVPIFEQSATRYLGLEGDDAAAVAGDVYNVIQRFAVRPSPYQCLAVRLSTIVEHTVTLRETAHLVSLHFIAIETATEDWVEKHHDILSKGGLFADELKRFMLGGLESTAA